MPYNEHIATRVKEIISATEKNVEEKKMFGGLCFMVNDKMCVGVEEDRLMVRLNPEVYEEVLSKTGCTPMDFTGRPMKGFVYVSEQALATKKQLAFWIKLALDFNKIVKPSAKKKKK